MCVVQPLVDLSYASCFVFVGMWLHEPAEVGPSDGECLSNFYYTVRGFVSFVWVCFVYLFVFVVLIFTFNI